MRSGNEATDPVAAGFVPIFSQLEGVIVMSSSCRRRQLVNRRQ